jgi:uncharacterized protein YndB with AHSA1/START domain
MILRMWRGWVRSDKLAEYVEIIERTGIAGYRRTPGNVAAQLVTRDLGDGRTELLTLSWWTDLEVIRGFAGDDIDAAKYYPEDDAYLVDRETEVAHYTVAAPYQMPGAEADPARGFTVTRVLDATPSEVFAHFVKPELFARWFVVEGFSTPADRISLDPKPGGLIGGVMVPDAGGPEIPFTARYGTVSPPKLVEFVFTDPDERVTLDLQPLGDEGTQLAYRNQGASPRGRARALEGVHRMIDALEAATARKPPPVA